MKYLPRVVDFKYHSGYKIILTFDNGKVKLVDFKNRLKKGVFKPLKNLNLFKRIRLDGHSIAWENGADCAPETLYEIGIEITPKPAKSQALHRLEKKRHNSKAA